MSQISGRASGAGDLIVIIVIVGGVHVDCKATVMVEVWNLSSKARALRTVVRHHVGSISRY